MSVTVTRSGLELTDVAEVMRSQKFDPEWLIEDWLYVGAVHWMQGPPGEGKTWLALRFCAQLIRRGETVLYLDEENNVRIMAERLLLFGCTPEQVEAHFLYAQSPTLDDQRLRAYEATLAEHRPRLIVFDASADFLAVQGADENSSMDVTGWIARVVRRPMRTYGSTAVVLDHTPHEARRARGSGAKKAKPEVAYTVTTKEPFSRYRVGTISVELDKDREGWLPFEREIHVGTSPSEGFVFEELPEFKVTVKPSEGSEAKVLAVLADAGPCTRGQIQDAAEISKATFFRAIKALEERREVKRGPTRGKEATWEVA